MSVIVHPGAQWQFSKPQPFTSRVNYAHPITRGLIGRWLFNERPIGRLYDIAGGKHMDFAGSGGVQWSNIAPKAGHNSVFVNGTGNYLNGAGLSPLNGVGAFTMVGWLYG